MKTNLSRDRLKNYSVSNSAYYLKYLEKFNKKGKFYSWNWSVFFFPYAWAAYRNLWQPYFILLLFNCIITATSYALVTSGSIRESHLILSGILFIVAGSYAIFLTLRANSLFLTNAQHNDIEEDKHAVINTGKSPLQKVIFAVVIFLTPNLILSYHLTKHYMYEKDRSRIHSLSWLKEHSATSINDASRIIDDINEENISIISYGYSALDNVVCLNSIDLLNQLKNKGADLNASALFQAVKCSATTSVRYLVDAGVVLDDEDLTNAVCIAVYQNQLTILKSILADKVNLKTNECQFGELLKTAVDIQGPDRIEFVKLLIEKGGNTFRQLARKNIKALESAVRQNDLLTAKSLLEMGISTSADATYGSIVTSSFEHPDPMLELLLAYKADPNATKFDRSLLVHALDAKLPDKVKILIKAGANVTPKIYKKAVEVGHKENIKLIEQALKTNKVRFANDDVVTLFRQACKSNDITMIDNLLGQGHDINARDKSGTTALYSCIYESISTVSHMISKGADVNALPTNDTYKRNLLQKVIYHDRHSYYDKSPFKKKSFELLKVLLKNGIDVNHQESNGQTAMMLLISRGNYWKAAHYIFDHSDVDTTLQDEYKQTLLYYAVEDPALLNKVLNKLKKKVQLEKTINLNNSAQHNALQFAASSNVESVKLLLKAGINPRQENAEGFTAIAYAKDRSVYDILKPHANKDSLDKARCRVFVAQEGNKKWQSSCIAAAKKAKALTTKTFYLFLGGELKELTSMELEISSCRCGVEFINIGHGYLLSGQPDKARENYEKYLSYANASTPEERDKNMQEDFALMEKLYGKQYQKQAAAIWKDVSKR